MSRDQVNHDQPRADGRRRRVLIGSLAAVAALGVGTFLTIGGESRRIADDGAHKLSTPATLLNGSYKKANNGGPLTEDGITMVESLGVRDFKDVSAVYHAGTGLTMNILSYSGFYGTVDDPEKAVDAWFARMNSEASSDDRRFLGRPTEMKPSGFENGIMKCQQVETDDVVIQTDAVCIWGDHSTLGFVTSNPPRLGSASATLPTSLEDAATLTAKVRKEVRIKA